MILANTDHITGREIVHTYGLVMGNTVRATHIVGDMKAGFRGFTGGRVKEYVNMINESRDEAINEMIFKANSMGADAIVNVRFSTSSVMQTAAEVMVYGTAVKLK